MKVGLLHSLLSSFHQILQGAADEGKGENSWNGGYITSPTSTKNNAYSGPSSFMFCFIPNLWGACSPYSQFTCKGIGRREAKAPGSGRRAEP